MNGSDHRTETRNPGETRERSRRRGTRRADRSARGEPFLWGFGGTLALGVLMVVGFLVLVIYNGATTFWPKPIKVLTLADGTRIAGEPFREEEYRPHPEEAGSLPPSGRDLFRAGNGRLRRILYRTGNFDLYNDDFRWVPDYAVQATETPVDFYFIERMEWGPFIGRLKSLEIDGKTYGNGVFPREILEREHKAARRRLARIRTIEREEIGAVNRELERGRLELRKILLEQGSASDAYRKAAQTFEYDKTELEARYKRLAQTAAELKRLDARHTITLEDVNGTAKTHRLSELVRLYPANALSLGAKLRVYLSRWTEFLVSEPREANTEGGVMPAIFGTLVMTALLALLVGPFGVIAALFLREYAGQGRLVSLVRISVNNLAGVPSIVYGIFGLGFFAYTLGGKIDALFFPERLPTPTFGTGGLLWASLTLALLTVPVVIVATEEALAAVPQSMREGSLACGASKWQTIKNIVLPRAFPGVMTGLILAMARGAGEVAPLMLVGVVKLAPELPVDGIFPFIHLERSFMHLGFHIYDVGFQSRNAEAGKPMVFVTTVLLISLVAFMNLGAVYIRNRLKRKFQEGHF